MSGEQETLLGEQETRREEAVEKLNNSFDGIIDAAERRISELSGSGAVNKEGEFSALEEKLEKAEEERIGRYGESIVVDVEKGTVAYGFSCKGEEDKEYRFEVRINPKKPEKNKIKVRVKLHSDPYPGDSKLGSMKRGKPKLSANRQTEKQIEDLDSALSKGLALLKSSAA